MPQKAKILIIEDEQMLSAMYKIKFENEGYDIMVANDGAEGLEIVKKNKFDMILLDIIMPKIDGFAVLKQLREQETSKDTPVILLTNLGQDEDVSRGKELGAVGYLIKANNTPAEVVEKVQEHLNKKNAK